MQGKGRRRYLRRGRFGLPAAPEVPEVRLREGGKRRADPGWPPKIQVPRARRPLQLPHEHGVRELQEGFPDPGAIRRAHDVERPRRGGRRGVRHNAPDRLGMAAPRVRDGGRVPGRDRAGGPRLDRRGVHRRRRPRQGPRGGAQARPFAPAALHRRRDRRAEEPRRRRLRARQAVDRPHQGRPPPAHQAGLAHSPRQGEGPQRAGSRREVHRRGVQGRRARSRLPGMHGDGEQPVLLAEALSEALRRHGPEEPSIVSQLVRVPVQGQPIEGAVAQKWKGWFAIC